MGGTGPVSRDSVRIMQRARAQPGRADCQVSLEGNCALVTLGSGRGLVLLPVTVQLQGSRSSVGASVRLGSECGAAAAGGRRAGT